MTRIEESKVPDYIPMPATDVCLKVKRAFDKNDLAGAAKLVAESYEIKPAQVLIDDNRLNQYDTNQRQKQASMQTVGLHCPMTNYESGIFLRSNPTLRTFAHEFCHSLLYQSKVAFSEETVCNSFADNFVQQALFAERMEQYDLQSKRLWQEGNINAAIVVLMQQALLPLQIQLQSLESQLAILRSLQ